MKGTCFLSKLFVALGVSFASLALGAFVTPVEGGCTGCGAACDANNPEVSPCPLGSCSGVWPFCAGACDCFVSNNGTTCLCKTQDL
jgi:hypothetical protein